MTSSGKAIATARTGAGLLASVIPVTRFNPLKWGVGDISLSTLFDIRLISAPVSIRALYSFSSGFNPGSVAGISFPERES